MAHDDACQDIITAARELCDPERREPAVDRGLTARDLTLRSHSWRNFESWEVLMAIDNDGKREVRRQVWPFIEAGRFAPMLQNAHRFVSHLDRDEVEDFYRANPDLMDWVSVWGFSEDLRTFADERPDDIFKLSPWEIVGIEPPG